MRFLADWLAGWQSLLSDQSIAKTASIPMFSSERTNERMSQTQIVESETAITQQVRRAANKLISRD